MEGPPLIEQRLRARISCFALVKGRTTLLQSSADNASRSAKSEERLFPLWKLIGLGISALVVLGMLYGNQRILQQVANVEHPDYISLFFLTNIQREHPQDKSWRILLAKQQLELGELSDFLLLLHSFHEKSWVGGSIRPWAQH
jgi:hypothetical protein